MVATHGGVIKALRAVWTNTPPRDIPHVSNASVTVVEYDYGKATFFMIDYNKYLLNKITEQQISTENT